MPLPTARGSRRHSLITSLTRIAVAALFFAASTRLRAASAEFDGRVRDLLSQMTLEEKAGQLVQFSSRKDMTGPVNEAAMAPAIGGGAVGSLLNVTGAAETRKWQKLAVESSRLHLPLLFGLDVIHGYRTIFPISLATASTWDLKRIEQAERIAATEAAAAGVHWTFAPMVDIARDPRWGRIAEGAGEDPYLGALIARARVRGFQGRDLTAVDTVLACAKHFAAYGAAQAGRDYFTTDVSARALREVYLPPFHAAVQEGVGSLMAGFNDVDGIPASANRLLLMQILRQEWGFSGFVVSDWASIAELQAHGYAADLREAAGKAMLAGVDMDMESSAYGPFLPELVRSGAVPQSRLDAAAGAVLTAKLKLGLLDDPYRYSDEARERETLLRPEYLEAARDMARRSFVLLKNERDLLPLPPADIKIALVGPMADSPRHQLGAWEARAVVSDTVTLRAAFEKAWPELRYAEGCTVRGDDTSGFAAAVAAAREADVVVAALGEDAKQSGEAASRTSLELSGPQVGLLRELRKLGKPIVLVLMCGRPLTIEPIEPLVDAILVAWHPGTMGGPAVVDVLTGAYNPAGRLTVTWPRNVGQVPMFHAHKSSGRPKPNSPNDTYYSRYIDAPSTPHYPFGYGLSYTTYDYGPVRLSTKVLPRVGDPLRINVRVTNTGARAGEEVVQLYLRDKVGSVTRPVRELKAFQKIELAAGESREVEFELTREDLAFWRADLTWGTEPGEFEVYVGSSAAAERMERFTLE